MTDQLVFLNLDWAPMESTREIFNKCCNEIAAPFVETGFQYNPTRHSAIRASGDLKFEIYFQSSFRNYLVPDGRQKSLKRVISKLVPSGDLATFGNVTLIEHASVRSKMMKSFRMGVPNSWKADDIVTGGQIGNLELPARWVEFNLANPHTRGRVIEEARRLIDTVALPYFELFRNPADVVARLLDGSMPWTWQPSALEYVCCFGNASQSVQLLTKFINDEPAREVEYRDALLHYRSEGVPDAWDSGVAARLAKAAIILGLDSR